MTISLNVLNHLGLNLYSNHPAVLSEAVANAWDANAHRVDITLDKDEHRIVVQDDGDGMTLAEINERFLRVGYQRRTDPARTAALAGSAADSGAADSGAASTTEDNASRTSDEASAADSRAVEPYVQSGGDTSHASAASVPRPVMGRKGIGKLSLFSIAKTVLVETARNGEKNALLMDVDDIKTAIGRQDPTASATYRPEQASTDGIDFEQGTRITLTRLKHGVDKTANHLSRRLARRFSILGPRHDFCVFVGGNEVTPSDVEHLRNVQYLWTYGIGTGDGQRRPDASLSRAIGRAEQVEERSSSGLALTGWIGTVQRSNQLRDDNGDDLNRIAVMVRGKLAQEDLLDEFNEGGVYRAYLVGELHADFLDEDDEDDIATSSRQRIREDDPRFEKLRDLVQQELKHIQSQWSELRSKTGAKAALENPAIKAWFETLHGDVKRKATLLFGRINQLTVDDETQRRELFAHGVLAFETMRHRQNLDALEGLDPQDLPVLTKLFTESSDLEAVLYHRIVRSRVEVIEKLSELADQGARESFLQKHIFDHLWLLDPSWERATDAHMERSMRSIFDDLEQKAPADERRDRFDIRYQKTTGTHVIVELKKADVVTTTGQLLHQVSKYRSAMRRALAAAGRGHEGVSVVCLVGRELRDWSDPEGREDSARSLEAINTRVVMYDELLSNSLTAYQEYLDTASAVGPVQAVLDELSR